MKNIIILLTFYLCSFSNNAQENLELISKFNYVTTTQFDGTKRTSKIISVFASVNDTNNFIIADQSVKESKSLIYMNNTKREEKSMNGKMIIHYDSPKFGKNQIAYLDNNSLTLILPNKQKLIFSIDKPTNTTIIK